MFVAKDSTLEEDFISKEVSGSNIFLEEIRDAQQMDVDDSTLEAEVLMPFPMVEEMHQMHNTLPMHDFVLEQVIPALPLTAPLGPSSCENSQIVENNISLVAAPHRSSRLRIPSKKYVDFLLNESSKIVILEHEEPTSYINSLTSQNSDKWLGAMNSE